jgi:SRSO17 transposase
MEVQTSPAALPEWHAFVGGYQVRLRRPEGRETLERYTTSLLIELPHPNGDPIAQAVPGIRAQRVQECLTKMPWDEADLHRQRVQQLMAEATRGEGVFVCDETGFPKPGTAWVGVARQ